MVRTRFFGGGLLATVLLAGCQAGSAAAPASDMKPRASAQTSDQPAVVELFTSQGCSSCPPADRLAARLVRDPDLLVVTRPVTYWDRLGWKDTLALPENTELQRAYAAKGRKGAGVYTPQMVVDGGDGDVGSRENAIRALVAAARTADRPDLVVSDADGAKTVTISGKTDHMTTVSLLALSSHERVQVGRGENGGRLLDYTNVLKSETPLGSWRGGTESYRLTDAMLSQPGADRYAVIVRYPQTGRIVAARKLDL